MGVLQALECLKMLIDLEVTSEIHSSVFAKSHNMPPYPMQTIGRQKSSVARLVKHQPFAS